MQTPAENGRVLVSLQGGRYRRDVDRHRMIARELRRPIAAGEVRFKVQRYDREHALCEVVAYIDARTVTARLNRVCPGEWEERTEPLSEVWAKDTGRWYRCYLTVAGVTHDDVGEGDDPKGGFSDALKRAAVRFGVAECLYAFKLPLLQVAASSDEAPSEATLRYAEALSIEASSLMVSLVEGKARLRAQNRRGLAAMYRHWLETVVCGAFGEPLAHGPAISDEGERDLADVEEPEVKEVGETGDQQDQAAEARRRIVEAASGAGIESAEPIAALARLLLGRARDDGREIPTSDAFVAELCRVLGLVTDAGWTRQGFEEALGRAFSEPGSRKERRERFLAALSLAEAS